MRKVAIIVSIAMLGVGCKDDKKKKEPAPARRAGKPAAIPTTDLGDEVKKPFADKSGPLGDTALYEESKVLWERPMHLEVSKDAYDSRTKWLYGVDSSQTRVQAVDVMSGRIVWTGPAELWKPPKKFDPDKHPKKANDQSLEPHFQLLGGKLFVAQNVIKGDAKKGDLVVKLHAYEAASGRRLWGTSMPNTWGDGKHWVLWKEEGALYLGDSADGPLHIIDQATGKTRHTFVYPSETDAAKWVYAGGGDGQLYYYQDRGKGILGLAAFDAQTGAARWISAVLQECYNDPMYLRLVVASTVVCKWKGRGHNIADRVVQFDPRTGQQRWATLVFEAGAMSKEAKYASNVNLRLSKDKSAIFYRNLFGLVRLEYATGREVWRRGLNPERHVLFILDGQPWKSEIVQAGEHTNDEIVSLDGATGKEAWKVVTPGKNESLPGHLIWQGGKLVLFGDYRVYAYGASDGKVLLAMENRIPVGAYQARTKIDSVSLLGDVVVVSASGVRTGYELVTAKKVMHEPSNDESSLNWSLDLDEKTLLVYDDDENVVRALGLGGGARAAEPPTARFLTPPGANVVAPRFSAAGDRIGFTSESGAGAWSVVIATGQAEAWAEYKRRIANGVAAETAPKGDANELVVTGKSGKTPLTANHFGDLAWSHAGDKLVFAETAKATKTEHFSETKTVAEQWVKVYTPADGATRTVLTLASFPEKMDFVRAQWSPDDATVALLFDVRIGKATRNALAVTVPASGGAKVTLKIDDSTGTATMKGTGKWNGGPTANLGFVKEEAVDDIAWSKSGKFAYVRRAIPTRSRLHIVDAKGRELVKVDGATDIAWSPDGMRLAVNRQGNIWMWADGAWRAVTSYPPKREPVNEEEAVNNPLRLRDLAWSPDGKRLAFAVFQPGPGRRLATVDVK